MSITDISAHCLDVVIRGVGWHFMHLTDDVSSWAAGRTEESARKSAMVLALKKIRTRFNAADGGRITIKKYPGFYIARAVFHTRHIQQGASIGLADEVVLRVAHAL